MYKQLSIILFLFLMLLLFYKIFINKSILYENFYTDWENYVKESPILGKSPGKFKYRKCNDENFIQNQMIQTNVAFRPVKINDNYCTFAQI